MKSKEKRRIHEEEEGDDAFLSPDDENDDVEEDENADPSTPSRSSADDGLRCSNLQTEIICLAVISKGIFILNKIFKWNSRDGNILVTLLNISVFLRKCLHIT